MYILELRLNFVSEKKGAKEGVIYNSTVRAYYNRRLPNGWIFLNANLCFSNGFSGFNMKGYYFKHLFCFLFATYIDYIIHNS